MRKIGADPDVMSGICLSGLGVYIFVTSLQWNYTGPDGPGPGFFPFWYGLLILALSLGLIMTRVIGTVRGTKAKETLPVHWSDIRRGLMTWAAFAVAVALFQPLGFSISFALLILFLMLVVFRRTVLEAAIVAVLGPAAFHVIFDLGFDMRLPVGFLGI